jgi:hypothetical protein
MSITQKSGSTLVASSATTRSDEIISPAQNVTQKKPTIEGTGIVGWLGSVSVRYSLIAGEFNISPFSLAILRRRYIQRARKQTSISAKKLCLAREDCTDEGSNQNARADYPATDGIASLLIHSGSVGNIRYNGRLCGSR